MISAKAGCESVFSSGAFKLQMVTMMKKSNEFNFFENNHNFLLNFARTPREHHHAILDMILDMIAKTIEEALIVIKVGR